MEITELTAVCVQLDVEVDIEELADLCVQLLSCTVCAICVSSP